MPLVDILGSIDNKIENNEKEINLILSLAIAELNDIILKATLFVTLGDRIKFIKGKKPYNRTTNLLPYLNMDGIASLKFLDQCADNMIIANEDDVLVLMDGASSGKVFTGQKGIVASTMSKIDIEGLDNSLVFWYLKSKESVIYAQNTGSAIPHTNKAFISEMKIPVASNNHLSYYRRKLIHIDNENKKLNELKQLYLKNFFG